MFVMHAPRLEKYIEIRKIEKNTYLQISIKHCNIKLNSNLIVSTWCLYMLYAVLFNSML